MNLTLLNKDEFMYIPTMNEKEQFSAVFEMTNKLYRTMVYGLFIYPLFVAGVETFHWAVFHFLNFETMKTMGLVFMILTLVSFPVSYFIHKFFVRGVTDIPTLAKKLMFAEIANMAISEIITIFGLIIYITSANLKFFYLFFIISFIHLLLTKPNRKKWQNFIDFTSEC